MQNTSLPELVIPPYLLFFQLNLELLDFESKVFANFFDLSLDIVLEASSLTYIKFISKMEI